VIRRMSVVDASPSRASEITRLVRTHRSSSLNECERTSGRGMSGGGGRLARALENTVEQACVSGRLLANVRHRALPRLQCVVRGKAAKHSLFVSRVRDFVCRPRVDAHHDSFGLPVNSLGGTIGATDDTRVTGA
jgi:hypothetical protein